MMKEKKLITRLNTIADWIIKIIMINILIISTSLLVVTILPAVTAGYKLFCDYIKKDETPIVRTFFKYFKENIINKIILNLIVIVLLFINLYSNKYYGNIIKVNPSVMGYFGYIFTMILSIVIIITTLYLPIVLGTISEISIEKTIKYSFYIMIKFFLITIALVFISVLPGLLLLTSLTILLLIFGGISLPLLSIAIITTKPRALLIKLEETKNETRD